MKIDAASTVLNDALKELGLYSSPLADPYAITDQNVVQMCALLKALGADLLREYDWSHLQRTYTFETSEEVESYALPDDYARMLHSTAWNRTTTVQLGGGLRAQDWQALKASDAVSPVDYYFRIYANRLFLHPVPTTVANISFEYQGGFWVQPSGESVPTTDTPSAATDLLWFDAHLLSRGLKVAWKEAKRLDSSAERNAYERALAQVQGGDGAPPVLSLSRASACAPGPRMPSTRWGV